MRISREFVAIVSIFLYFSTTEAIVVKQETSLFGPYEVGGQNLAWWDFIGSAQPAGTAIRLTTDESEKQGAIWNNFPFLVNDWEVHVQFHIHGKGVHLNGDGMAIWYVRESLLPGPVFGYRDNFCGLGLFIDTFENPAQPHKHRHPYISAVINNGSQHYEHDAEGTVAQVGGCYAPIRNLEWPTKLAISYINQVLTVFIDVEGKESWETCFKAFGVKLPTGYRFGVTASTGVLSDNHDVISITALDMNLPDKAYEDRSHVIPYAEFVEIPGRPRVEHVPEEPPKIVEQKREVQPPIEIVQVHEPIIIPEVKEIVPEVKESPPEHKIPEVKVEEPEPIKPAVKVEPLTPPPATFFRKAVYIAGMGVILYVALHLFRKYRALRKERMQKRLF